MRKATEYKRAFKAAFPYTVPIFAGFWFLGITYGIYMNVSGFPFWYPMIMSIAIPRTMMIWYPNITHMLSSMHWTAREFV